MNRDPEAEDADLIARADAAAAARRFGEALEILGQVIASGSASVETLLKAASLHRHNAEPRRALGLIEQALAIEPLHFLALFYRAGLYEQLGNPQAARAYGEALAQRQSATLPPSLEAAVARAERIYAGFVAVSSSRLGDLLANASADATPLEQSRLARFASNAARDTHPHRSDPTDFFFPGLGEYEFHDRSFFPWLTEVEAATDTIRAEFETLLGAERAELVPYVQYDETVPMRQWKPLNNSLDWTAIHLMFRGDAVEQNARHCPATMALLKKLPQPDLPGNSPNAMFSLLKPGTQIPPHHGVANFRLVCHLPLIVPDKCWFRVGATRREWKVGEAFVFDDTIEHEAANDSDQLRVVLIFDVWHPGLSPAEQSGIKAMLGALPGFGGHL